MEAGTLVAKVAVEAGARPAAAGPDPPAPRILNVGCGATTYGTHRVDFDRTAAVTELASSLHLPYRDGAFDEVYADNILEHMPNPLLFLQEAARVLRRGGRLVLITDHAAYLGFYLKGLRFADNHQFHGVHGDRHYMLFTEGHLRNFCDAAGLKVERITLMTKYQHGFLGRMLQALWRPFGMPQIRVEAVKP